MDVLTDRGTIGSLAQAVDEYLVQCRIRGLSGRTITTYRTVLGALPAEWPLTTVALSRHFAGLVERRRKPSSRKCAFVIIRTFCRWAVRGRLLASDPTDGTDLGRIRLPRPILEVPTQAEVEAILRACPKTRTGMMLRTMLILVVDTGLRMAEVLHLRWDDLDPANRRLVVRAGKGARDDILPYGTTTAQALSRWAEALGLRHLDGWVFPTRTGRPYPKSVVDRGLRAVARRAGVRRPYSLHKFRHYYATALLRHGVDLETVRRLMRHSSLTTTQRYLHLLGTDLTIAHRRASPADWLAR